MKCPFCNSADTRVKNSRHSDDNMSVRRRRLCEVCNSRFTTLEELLLKPIMVLKKDGRMEPFDKQKLLTSIMLATNKRPVTPAQINMVLSKILYKFESVKEDVIPARVIGEIVKNNLLVLDKVAYIRFVSVYMDFSDADDFCSLVEKIKEGSDK
ncbi:transcriptional regulator NrdR [Anaplasma phagocytophilum]|uniref:Transcriptional repressor NrdR n=6 Tax=Anaplasma phagocytophilum TaxID=948 RepID=A0A098EE25_ANAPH|nr:transcriptional regulator NrdR [Anaplasma phagocytophilum]KJV64720.1 transcriptional regulator NrdR [Anaplasma phagocytophilum str. ApMUC09]KJZ99184.1 transcriptional regulator NrdR [Anaplasma phagocytophilum str. CR1007]AGR79814.1 NrdR family transcriptional regulator [Anaplasma phagocytophilum str. JM]AGR81070.1 NrdR family transcriptional regulator [Anaplasma phagocytophilum str. Dog2]ANC33878.1 transcriptional regulator NrdR [Anaplasma phagocytophilum str. Norway variant2]